MESILTKTEVCNKREKKIFTPYYINFERLIDIYTILNDGYSEYSDITTKTSENNEKSGKVSGSVGKGFKILDLGFSTEIEAKGTSENHNEKSVHKIHTITSILSNVENSLNDNGYINEIDKCKVGDFVCLPVILQLNSFNKLFEEIEEFNEFQKLATGQPAISGKQFETYKKLIKKLVGYDEVYFEEDNYAIFGNINENNYYQCNQKDIINMQMICMAQVKKIYNNGTSLLKNTLLSKFSNEAARETFFDELLKINKNSIFSFDANIKSKIENKPVIQLEIIALYQEKANEKE